jgi:hypothetical protein
VTTAPTTIDGATVLLMADVRGTRPTGNTRHRVDGVLRTDFSFLVIARYPEDDGAPSLLL